MGFSRRAAIAFLAAAAAGPAAAEFKLVDETGVPSPARQYGLHSEILRRDLIVRVAPPARPVADGAKVAAFYTLDATTSFDLVSAVARNLQQAGKMAPAYVVAIGYPGDALAARTLRTYDYLHVAEGPFPNGGGGAAFERAVREEIRPFIEARLPIDPGKAVLGGHSFGGLFAAHVAAEHPDAFAGYLVSSASLWVGDEEATRDAAETAKGGRGGGRRVYLSVGGTEGSSMTDTSARFAAALSTSKSGYEVRRQVWPGETHGSVYPFALLQGLAFVLPPEPGARSRADG